MEADVVWFAGVRTPADDADEDSLITEDSWSIEQGDEFAVAYRLTHTVSARGRDLFDATGEIPDDNRGWRRAREAVNARLGFDQDVIDALTSIPTEGLSPFNHARSVSTNEEEGTYSVTETWLLYDPSSSPDDVGGGSNAIEDFTVTTRSGIEQDRTQVSVEGSITGLLERNAGFAVTKKRWENAKSRWDAVRPSLHERAKTWAGLETLNPTPVGVVVGQNLTTGVLTYSYEFDNRFLVEIAGAKSVAVNVSDVNSADVFASHVVIARPAGPILQPIGTTTQKSRTVSVECVVDADLVGGLPPQSVVSGVLAVILSYKPVAAQVFVQDDQVPSWSPSTGRYARTVTYVYQ